MTDAMDMSTPVTRGELRAELAQLEIRLEQKLEQMLEQKLEQILEQKLEQILEQKLEQMLPQKLAHLATKAELELWGGALLARIESGEQRLLARIESGERRLHERIDGLERRIDDLEQRLFAELARHTKAICESLAMQISVVDEKYADLPRRVSRLEAEVFPSRRR